VSKCKACHVCKFYSEFLTIWKVSLLPSWILDALKGIFSVDVYLNYRKRKRGEGVSC
ncbi:hypothetical protein TorRG33x02_049730, partial [Trema orientale]